MYLFATLTSRVLAAHGELQLFLPLLNIMMGKSPHGMTLHIPHSTNSLQCPDKFVAEPGQPVPKTPVPWPQSMKPHPLTSRLARFKGDVAVSASSDEPLANTIYEARCEITSTDIALPIGVQLSSCGTVLLLHGMGGWKNRAPVLRYFFPDDSTDILLDQHKTRSGLSDIAYWTTTDEERRLIFAADTSRIKSYAWGPTSGPNYNRALPTHTMNTGKYEGPLFVLSGGRLIRAGQGAVGVWNLDGLPTHGDKGKTLIGGQFDAEDSWRDDHESIESSSGSPADTDIKLEDASLYPNVWAAHPAKKGVMICGADPSKTNRYSTVAVDLEGGGKSVGKYIGHGAELSAGGIAISASPEGDKNMFVTACMDGLARLYDVRHPLPVLSMDSGRRSEGCPAAVLIHPDGIPSALTIHLHLPYLLLTYGRF
jgi:WD40 repeat protein